MSTASAADVAFTLTFDMHSDWGVGTGTGRSGDVDALVTKDALGLPMLPAKSITGIVREACEEVAFALDGRNETGPWHTYLDHLLGDQPAQAQGGGGQSFAAPRKAALSLRPGRLSPAIRQAVSTRARTTPTVDPTTHPLAAAATIVRPQIAIDPATGTTAKGSLRMIERGRAGQRLTSEATLEVSLLPEASVAPSLPEGLKIPQELASLAGSAPQAAALLSLAQGLVTHIGADRRRGAGRCVLGFAPAAKVATPASSAATPSTTTVHRFGVECLTPVVASAGVTGNVVHTLDYLPGYLLLPVVAAALGSAAGALIAGEDLLVSDAVPGDWEDGAGPSTRMLPAPATWQVAKGDDDGTVTSALQVGAAEAGPAKARPVAVRIGWADPSSPPTTARGITKVRRAERAHAVIDDLEQRPTQATGGLYVQEAIPAGSRFVFEVRAPFDRVPLPNVARLGRSKKDDYGSVQLTALDPVVDPQSPEPRTDSLVRVLLTSDCLVLDTTTLAPTTDPDVLARQVAEALGLATTGAARAYTTARRHETWSATWGLPRPSLVGMRAGSVIEFESTITDPEDFARRASTLEAQGIGVRRAEGFGRMLINPDLLDAPAPPTPEPDTEEAPPDPTPQRDQTSASAPPVKPTDADAHPELLGLWRTAVLNWAAEAALDAAIPPDGARTTLGLRGWTNSQLGLLREAVTRSPGAVRIELTAQERLNDRVKQLEKLADLLSDPAQTWGLLGVHSPPDPDKSLSMAARQMLLLHCIQQELRVPTEPVTTQEGRD